MPPLRKLALAWEIVASYARVRWLMRRSELQGTVATLRRRSRPGVRLPLPDAGRDGERLGRAVVRTLSALPADSRCLVRSLVLLRLLARRGADGALVIAVRPTDALGLDAHAWIELDGRPLLDPGTSDLGRLVML